MIGQDYIRMFQAHFVGLQVMKHLAALEDNTRKLVDECGAKDTLSASAYGQEGLHQHLLSNSQVLNLGFQKREGIQLK